MPVNLRTVSFFNCGDDVGGGDGAEELAVLGGLHSDRNIGKSFQGFLDLAGVLSIANNTILLSALDSGDLLFGTAGGDNGLIAGKQEVPCVTILDLDDIAGGTKVVNGSGEDQLH